MKRIFIVLVILVCFARTCKAALPVNTEVIKKAVVFVYQSRTDGQPDSDHPIGTGFLVGIGGSGSFYLFLITARHILDPAWAYCPPNPNKIFLRFNKTLYDPKNDPTGVEYVPIDLVADGHQLTGLEHLPRGLSQHGQPLYRVSDDDQVDAAIIQLELPHLPQSRYDYMPLMISDFATPEEINSLVIGDSIISAGLLPGQSGVKRNYPFFKFGNISNIPAEPVWTGCPGLPALRLEKVWFVATNLVGGNSGSPILYVPNGSPGIIIGGAIGRPALIGIQSESLQGADLAGMTPVADLFRIFEQWFDLPLDLYRGPPRTQK